MIRPVVNLASILSRKASDHLRAFKQEVEQKLPGQVDCLVLFGSRARGDASRKSDYDVAVFIQNLEDQQSVSRLLADLAYPHILKGIHIRPVALPVDFLKV